MHYTEWPCHSPPNTIPNRNANINSPQGTLNSVDSSTVGTIQNLGINQIPIIIEIHKLINKLQNSHTMQYNESMRMYLLIRTSKVTVEAWVSIFLINSPDQIYAEASLKNTALESTLDSQTSTDRNIDASFKE